MRDILKTFKRKKLATIFLIFGIFIGISVLSFNISYIQALKNENSVQGIKKENILKFIVPSTKKLNSLSEYILSTRNDAYTEVSYKVLNNNRSLNIKGVCYTKDYSDKKVLGDKAFSYSQANSSDNLAIVGIKLKDEVYKRGGKEYLKLNYTEFTVIGINKQLMNSNSVLIPMKTFLKYHENKDIMDMTFLLVSDSLNRSSINRDISNLLNLNMGVTDLSSDQYNLSTGVLNIITLIVILIAVINVINFTVLWITERTKEIALRKTVGATNRDIRNLIFNEILAMALVASVLSLIFQIIAYGIINRVKTIDLYLQISIKNFIGSFLVAFIISSISTIPLYFKVTEISPAIVLKEE